MLTLEDLDLERRGLDVEVGEAEERCLDEEKKLLEKVVTQGREELSMFLGTWTHLLIPMASLTFLHLLSILIEKGVRKKGCDVEAVMGEWGREKGVFEWVWALEGEEENKCRS